MESSLGNKLESIEAVVVTGGSSGIGACFIHQLTRLKSDLIICNISRTKPDLNLANFPIHHIGCDLGQRDQLEKAAAEVLGVLEGREGKVLLINNSGFGAYGHFPQPDLEHTLDMIAVNAQAVVHLTGLLLPWLKNRGGAIVNIASTAAFQPTPYMATYGATKAFLLHWSLALGEELRFDGVHVLAVCPGPTSSGFFKRAGFEAPVVSSRVGQTPEDVVETTFAALRRGKRMVVSGLFNKLLAATASRLPKPAAARLGEWVLRWFRLKKLDDKK